MSLLEKPWEIWNDDEAEILERAWGSPVRPRNTRHQRLIKTVAGLIEGETVLDVGCGLGHLYGVIRKKVQTYLGVDSSRVMIMRAQSYFGRDRFRVGSAYDLSRLPMFDTVVCLDVVKHVPETWPVLKQLWSKTRRELILVTNIGAKPSIRKTGRGKGKYLIYRVETSANLRKLFSKLPGKRSVEQHRFDDSKGTFIFRVTKHA